MQLDRVRSRRWFLGLGAVWSAAVVACRSTSSAPAASSEPRALADQVYAATAYVLFLNGIVGEHDVIDQTTLLRVKMPNRNGFIADPRPDVPTKKRN
jgi:hypothetical protein